MNWNDPAERARLAERVGPAEYNRLHDAHRKASVVSTVNGHDIRPVHSMRFGRLYAVGDTGKAFTTLAAATEFAKST